MLLAQVSEIRTQLGFDDMTDINAAITDALHAAEPQLASTLKTQFARASFIDEFWVSRPTFRDGQHVETDFLLTYGLLADTPVVTAGNTLALLASNPTTITDLKVDRDKGFIRDVRNPFNQQYVRISYTYGFEPDPDDAESYKIDQVPNWLKEAAKLSALVALADHASILETGTKLDKPALERQLRTLMSQHLRYAPMALLPL